MIAELKPYAEYRESGLPWIREMPSHWVTERAKWLFVKMSRPVRPEDEVVTCFRNGTVTLRKNRRLRGYTEATVEHGYQGIRKGDLVIHGMDAFAGAIGVSDSDGKGTPVYNVCMPRDGINAMYYAHLVRYMSQSNWILALAKGIRERSTDFRFETFADQRLPLPPYEEQAAIARILDWANGRLERAIRAKRRVIALLNEQKQAIIHGAITSGLNADATRRETGIPWISRVPSHWQVLRIGQLGKVGNGSTPSRGNPSYWSGGCYPWLNSSQVNRGFIESADQFVTDLARRECHLPTVPAGSVLVAITGQGKTRGMAAVLGIEATINQHVAYIACSRSPVSAEFLQLVLTAAYPELRALSDDSGSTKGALTCDDLKRFKIPIPPPDEQQQLLNRTRALTRDLSASTSKLGREVELMLEYRIRLASDVVTGKVDVRAAAAHLSAVDSGELELNSVDDTDLAVEEAIS